MHSSKIIRPSDEEFKRILDFNAPKVDMGIPDVAEAFLGEQPPPLIEPFRLDELVAKQTGVYESEKTRIDQRVDDRAVEKIQEIQERAYKEAYDLGLEEGRKHAYDTHQDNIVNYLKELQNLVDSIKEMKNILMEKNESLIVDLIYYCAEKVVMDHVEKKPESMVSVLKECLRTLDVDENVVVKSNDQDFEIVKHLMTQANPNLDFLNKIKFIPTPEIQKGGCIIETDHGLVDATLKERFEKLWNTLSATKPSGE